ncbi:MAG: NADH-quinone oxidoreductase subunit N [Phycisphaeraceae bacterium]
MNPTLPDWNTLRLITPELWLVTGMCAVILVPFIRRASSTLPAMTALVALAAALISVPAFTLPVRTLVLGDMLAIDPFSQFFKVLLIAFTMLVTVQWMLAGRHRQHPYDVPDFFCLLLGAAFGMALMASAANLLLIFIATESASFPSYALAGFRKRTRTGSEAALKYVIFGAAASAVMVYGMSMIYGATGTLDLGQVAAAAGAVPSPMLAVGLLALFAGVAFKLSAVPMHFWCPDVFEGAPIEVTTFLSVASKGAAVALLLRIVQAFPGASSGEMFTGLAVGVAILGAVTATWGNLVALHQTNIKRLLAYSSIAHSGYMIMAASLMAVATSLPRQEAIASALLFYLAVYLFMNMGAFTVAALIALRTGSEDIRDYAGMIARSPALAVLMTVFLLSLFGMPGLGGFMGKINLMVVMSEAGAGGFALIAVLLVNTLISLYYYMRPVYFMMFVPDRQGRPAVVASAAGLALLAVCTVALLWTGIVPGMLQGATDDYAQIFTRSKPPVLDPLSPGERVGVRGSADDDGVMMQAAFVHHRHQHAAPLPGSPHPAPQSLPGVGHPLPAGEGDAVATTRTANP